MTHNYNASQSYLVNYTLAIPNCQYYAPIIFIDPSLQLFISNFNLNSLQYCPSTPLLPCPEDPSAHPDQKHEKNETEDVGSASAGKENEPKQNQVSINYLTVSNRNILPNNLNLLLSYIRRINKSGKIVKRIIEKLDQGKSYSVKKFYSYQSYLKQHVPFHKTKHTLREVTEYADPNFNIFTLEQQMFYNKVCRIALKFFLRGDYFSTLLTSGKIHKTSKSDHLKVRRYLELKLSGASQYTMQPYKLIQN